MPATTATTPFDSTRTCPHPDHVGERTLPFTSDNFYIRPNGSADYWCRECVRRYNREQRRNRRSQDGRKFGVELEFLGGYAPVIREMEARGLTVSYEGYTHRVRRGAWKIVTDASVAGYELVSPPLSGAAGIAQVQKACEALVAAGARVDRSCGLHVHHEVSDLTIESFRRLFRLWSNAQGATDELVAASRRGSRWAHPLREDEVARIEALRELPHNGNVYIDRYRSLNIQAFGRYGTVEVRQHQGTINAKKVIAWIKYFQAIVRMASSDTPLLSFANAPAFLTQLRRHGLDTTTADYLSARADAFMGRDRQPVAA